MLLQINSMLSRADAQHQHLDAVGASLLSWPSTMSFDFARTVPGPPMSKLTIDLSHLVGAVRCGYAFLISCLSSHAWCRSRPLAAPSPTHAWRLVSGDSHQCASQHATLRWLSSSMPTCGPHTLKSSLHCSPC